MLKRFPDQANMTTALVRALVDDLREDRRDAEADALLANTFSRAKKAKNRSSLQASRFHPLKTAGYDH